MKEIGKITPHVYDKFLLLSFDLAWLNVFKKLPSFTVMIDNENRLVLKSDQIDESGGFVCE